MTRTKLITVLRSPERRTAVIASLALLLALVSATAGYLLATGGGSGTDAASGRRILYWYDPMVPMERYQGPGKSSMNMDLIPKYADGPEGGVRVSPAMIQSLGIRVVRAQVRDLIPSVPAVGRVELDERLIAEVQTFTPGFVESLAVRAEGEPVARGGVVASVYSPELYGAQQEYAALRRIRGSVITPGLRQAARNRLRLLGLPSAAIQRLDRGGAPQRTYAVFAPSSGFVSRIGARPGAQVTPGQSIVTIAGLSRVLVVAQVPEASLGSIRRGLPVRITFAALPGEVRQGTIDYIYPSLDPESRTARLRVTLNNPGLRLRQGMFANVAIMGTGGMALTVPTEAVIDTGRRKIVVVRRNNAFIPVEVTTGRDSGEWTHILSGIAAGEEVVASGQFLIDSEASLSGVMARLNRDNASRPPAAAAQVNAEGTVRSMDLQQGRVTIAHGPIPAMTWPAMTMTFSVRNPAMLRGLRRGDRVRFVVQTAPQGSNFVIVRIEKAPRS